MKLTLGILISFIDFVINFGSINSGFPLDLKNLEK